MKKRKMISFNTIEYDELCEIINLIPKTAGNIFDEWFNFDYSLSDSEISFLKDLIIENEFYVSSYTEEELKMKFLSPLLNKISFRQANKRDWYERPLVAEINGEKIGGIVDFMVAKGEKTPVSPYFFIQEFKRTKHASLPDEQLLAEMLVATILNKTNLIRGAYIIGRIWNFMILEKIGENSFQYFISKSFDSLDFDGLKQIFINLQAVKLVFCKD